MKGKSGKAEEKRRMSKVTLRGLAGFKVLWVFSVIFLVVATGCHTHRPPPPPEDHYDPRNISRTETASGGPKIGIDPMGTIHVVWIEASDREWMWSRPTQIYYINKTPGGDWSDPLGLTDSTRMSIDVQMGVDSWGNVHVIWEEYDWGPDSIVRDPRIYYRERDPSGNWSSTEIISPKGADQPRIAVDPSGTVHVVWSAGALWYTYKPQGGTWATPREVVRFAIAGENPNLAVDEQGNCHLVYDYSEEVYYVTGSPTGTWSEPVNVSQSPQFYSWYANVAVSPEGIPYVLWTEGDSRVFYRRKIDTLWTEADTIPGTRGHGKPRTKLLFFYGDKKYLLWGDGWFEIYLGQTKGELKDGLEVEKPFDPPGSPYPDAVLDEGKGVIHVVWSAQTDEGNWEVFYDVINP